MTKTNPTVSRGGPRASGPAIFLLALAWIALIPSLTGAQEPPPTLESLLRLSGVELTNLALDEAITTALDRSRDLREARLQLQEAEGLVSEAWGTVYPRFEFSGSYTRNISPPVSFLPEVFFDPDGSPDRLVPVAFGLDNVWSTTLSVEQPLFQAQAFIGVGAADRYRALQNEGVRGRAQEVVTRVRETYYELLLAEEQARLIERSVARVLESLEETRALNRAGLASDYDVLRLEVELANLEPQLRRAANQALRVERDLVTELDLPEGTRFRLHGELARMDLDDPTANSPANRAILELTRVDVPSRDDREALEALFARALAGSSTLRQAVLNEELRNTEVRLEQAEYLPRVSLFGNYQIQAQQEGGLDFFGASSQRGYGRLVGVQVSLPLFTGFQRSARVQQKRAGLRVAQIRSEVAGDRLRADLRNTLDLVDEARMRARGQRLAMAQATRGFEIASAQYREGLGSQLELTDAEVALRQSEFNYAEAVFDYLRARAELDRLVGDVPLL
jgi:outer membrane protein